MRRPAGLGLLAALLVAACGPAAPSPTAAPPSASPSPSASANPVTDWILYLSPQEGLHFRYPPDWTATPVASLGAQQGGDSVKVTSPAGTVVLWDSDVQGIGGACPPGSRPNVFVERVTPSRNLANAYIDKTTVAGEGAAWDLTDRDALGDAKPPTVGDTGTCFDVSSGLKSHKDPQRIVWLTTKRGVAAQDEQVVQEILESAGY